MCICNVWVVPLRRPAVADGASGGREFAGGPVKTNTTISLEETNTSI